MAESMRIDKLIFVYNADSGRWNAVADSAKKLLSINGCALCSLTHSLMGEKDEWRSCRETIGVPVESLHRDELPHGIKTVVGDQLPCVLAEVGGEMFMLLRPDVIARCRGSIGDFRGRLSMHAAMRGLELPLLPTMAGAS